ncbi:hypothetical protein HUG15_19895 [Salicibibacter cibarius]|uniref:Uncharacterized protein n=1 Tax=Salicibibacter cibarius TaxID=2743000 RepID=A0A7T6Z610_9BACI|nr:hypothetical protein [Salicibibacter cibarius]QQK77623.1 hypothetical protein HUG15_19895 [Salicibibacter cibarius]
MRTVTKIAPTVFLSATLLVACGDDEEEATGEDAPDTDDDTSEAEENDTDEDVDRRERR